MKKASSILLIVCLFVFSFNTVYAQEDITDKETVLSIDIGTCSDNELVTLLEQVQAEIAFRNIEKTANLCSGTYVGGKDIPIGSYILKNRGIDKENGIVSLAAAADPKDDYPSKLYEYTSAEEDYSVFIRIEEGDILTLPYAFDLTISAGAKFE